MSEPRAMAPLRRRGAIPGMTPPATAHQSEAADHTPASAVAVETRDSVDPPVASEETPGGVRAVPRARRGSADYGATRLVNFRLPVDLHDRYRRLVAGIEQAHPRLRRPSLTEVLIGLLEEGPETVDEVAAVIRRKRAAEYGEEIPS